MKRLSLKSWKKKVWKLYSSYIKKRDVDFRGQFVCISCLELKTDYQAGHYLHGYWPGTWLNDKNVHAQCKACNLHRSGNLNKYALELERRYDHGILQELDELKHQSKQVWNIGMLKDAYEEILLKTKKLP